MTLTAHQPPELFEPKTGFSSVFGRVGWTRGELCLPLAECLAQRSPIAIGNDLTTSCIEHSIDLLVTRRITSFDLVPQVAPLGVDLSRVRTLTAAVGGGPHSPLAAAVADRLAQALKVPAELATVCRTANEAAAAYERFERLGFDFPSLQRRVVHAADATALVETLTPSTLLVVGAPEGSWLHRQLMGPGPALAAKAPGGVIVTRSAPRRCFHAAVDPARWVLGPDLSVSDARLLMNGPNAPVARDGRLVGVVRERSLASVISEARVADIMEPPVAVRLTEPLSAVDEVESFFESGPIPVVDQRTNLIGIIPSLGKEMLP
jgi:hypothetical protein